MKIRFELPSNGYKSAIQEARENGEFDSWIDSKFGSRIRELISDDFSLTIDATSFTADFVYEDDAHAFLKHFGGRIVE